MDVTWALPGRIAYAPNAISEKWGDEIHALFICSDTVIKSIRDKFMTKIISFSNQFSVLSNNDKLLYML